MIIYPDPGRVTRRGLEAVPVCACEYFLAIVGGNSVSPLNMAAAISPHGTSFSAL